MWKPAHCLFVLLGLAGAAIAEPAMSIEGRWLTDDGKAVVTISRCGASLCGRIAQVLDGGPNVPKTDVKNPDLGLRSRPILGLPILQGFRADGQRWSGGTAYDPRTGKTYRAYLASDADHALKVTGCVFVICLSKRWTRVS